MRYFTSDFHFGHKNILKYRNEFLAIEEHDQAIYDMLDKTTKRDIVTVVGDVVFASEHELDYLAALSKFPCRFEIILGNHDALHLISQYPANMTISYGIAGIKEFWVSHCPIHSNEFRNRVANIHGHLHKEFIDDSRYVNVNVDVTNYRLISLEEIRANIKQGV